MMNLTNLWTALEAAENALYIYKEKKDDMGGKQNNIYGQALQEFQLGYLYEKYSTEFCSPISKEYYRATEDAFIAYRLLDDKKEGIDKAIVHFGEASRKFKKIDHYFGLYLSKKHES